MTCLVLGCSGVGKTLLLKRLDSMCGAGRGGRSFSDGGGSRFTEVPVTYSTVGTELVNLNVRGGGSAEVVMREVGGSMAPIWHNYYKDCAGTVIYIMDVSNRVQVSAAAILLYQVSSFIYFSLCMLI